MTKPPPLQKNSGQAKQRCAELQIAGMTCQSCEILLERKLRKIPGVLEVAINHRTGTARITANAASIPDADRIEKIITDSGYQLGTDHRSSEPSHKKWLEIGACLLIIFALYKVLQVFDLVAFAPSTSGALSYGGIFVIGLVAGTSSCLAVAGGLLLSLAAKHNELFSAETPWQKFRPLLHFNIGRLFSYFVLGGLVGLIGQSITLSTKMTGYLSIMIAFIMLYIALTILHIIPQGSFPIRPPKRLSHWIAGLSESKNPAAPFTLGAMTFFLPCGFTQSLQLVALASGNFLTGAFTMFIFALGTLPSLLGLSTIASTAQGTASRLFLRFSGALVLMLALFNLNSGFALTGINLDAFFRSPTPVLGNGPDVSGGVQTISMNITPNGYDPPNLTIHSGIPVRWLIDGTQARGCTSVLVVPDLNITRPLQAGINEIDFTAAHPGQLAFSCSMGMVRGSFTVL